jgi:hypothetical protein
LPDAAGQGVYLLGEEFLDAGGARQEKGKIVHGKLAIGKPD